MKAKEFIDISTRGRVAFSINCLENSINCQNLRISNDCEKLLLQQLWHFTSDNIALWELQIKELIPFVVSEEVDYLIKDYNYFSKKVHDILQNYYKQCNKYVLDIIDLIYELGKTNVFVNIDSNDLKEATLPLLQEIIDLMMKNNMSLPNIKLFEKFSISENNGLGREFAREEIFNDNL
ncbi:hypothetical protein [Flavobacterium sp. FlaQc-47]|uniref:hypothetical protein n=1 Tax=Flavobacterium sp. FlaQc-47 TaxID=3374180 RepID=UPI0037574DEA